MTIKKLLFLLCFVLKIITSINADYIYDFSLQIANLRTGVYLNSGKHNSIGLSAEMFNFYFENKNRRNCSFKLSPLNITSSFEIVDGQDTNVILEMYFLNICTYWNLWSGILNNYDDEEMVFGPFFSLRYLSLINFDRFNFRNIDVSTGIKWLYKTNNYNFIGNVYTVGIEIGYNYNYYTRHGIYLSLNIDLIEFFILIGQIGSFIGGIKEPYHSGNKY